MPPKSKAKSASTQTDTPSITALKQRYIGRSAEIDQLFHHVTGPGPQNCIYIYGPSGTGKTAIVCDLLSTCTSFIKVYINCQETTKPRPLLESILHQIKGGKRKKEDEYAVSVRCDSLDEFIATLPIIVSRRKATPCIVIDNAQRLQSTDLLPALSRISLIHPQLFKLVLISDVPWAAGKYFYDTQLIPEVKILQFKEYSTTDIKKILVGKLPPSTVLSNGDSLVESYRQFVTSVVESLARGSSSLPDLRMAVERLWIEYSFSLREVSGQNVQPAALMNRIRAELQSTVSELEIGGKTKVFKSSTTTTTTTPAGVKDHQKTTRGLAFELPYISKFLLLAAYIASRNKATTDRAVFDPGFSQRGRKNSQAMDRQTEAAIEAALKGPHSFPLERLLHIFYSIYGQWADVDDQEDGINASFASTRHEVQRAEVLMQLSTLVSLRLLSVSGGDVLEGGLYRCNLSDDMALAIAENVSMRLSDYLKLA